MKVKQIITAAVLGGILFTVSPAWADKGHFYCFATTAKDQVGYISEFLEIDDEDDHSEYSMESDFESYLESEYGVDVNTYELWEEACSANARAGRSHYEDSWEDSNSFIRNTLDYRLIRISEYGWDGQ